MELQRRVMSNYKLWKLFVFNSRDVLNIEYYSTLEECKQQYSYLKSQKYDCYIQYVGDDLHEASLC